MPTAELPQVITIKINVMGWLCVIYHRSRLLLNGDTLLFQLFYLSHIHVVDAW